VFLRDSVRNLNDHFISSAVGAFRGLHLDTFPQHKEEGDEEEVVAALFDSESTVGQQTSPVTSSVMMMFINLRCNPLFPNSDTKNLEMIEKLNHELQQAPKSVLRKYKPLISDDLFNTSNDLAMKYAFLRSNGKASISLL